jgi:hypothetical protein
MQIPIISGIYTDGGPDVRVSYPVNMMPVPKQNGINTGYIRPADGIVLHGAGPGVSRGGINWNGVCYRVMGDRLVTVSASGVVTEVSATSIAGVDLVAMDYSFDRLAIAAGDRLYYYDGSTLTQVTDADIGVVVDVVWVDGYFMTTDGENLIVTELTNPFSVNPLKYGSSEIDPDPVVALRKLRNEIMACNRYTIEVFDNIGGDFFPFQRVEGAQIQKGVIGTHACCVYVDTIAFIGSGRNEPPAVYVAQNATARKISSDDIDRVLGGFTEDQLSRCKVEARRVNDRQLLYIHLPDRCLVYDSESSVVMQTPVWFELTSSLQGYSRYLARDFVWAYDRWLCAHPGTESVGYMVDTIGSHWGADVRWEFGTLIIYNEGRGAIFHELELVALPGRTALGENPQIATSYSTDGLSWSQDKWIRSGRIGQTTKRLVWMQQGGIRNFRMQRFTGDTQSHVAFVRLEARLEAMRY